MQAVAQLSRQRLAIDPDRCRELVVIVDVEVAERGFDPAYGP